MLRQQIRLFGLDMSLNVWIRHEPKCLIWFEKQLMWLMTEVPAGGCSGSTISQFSGQVTENHAKTTFTCKFEGYAGVEQVAPSFTLHSFSQLKRFLHEKCLIDLIAKAITCFVTISDGLLDCNLRPQLFLLLWSHFKQSWWRTDRRGGRR